MVHNSTPSQFVKASFLAGHLAGAAILIPLAPGGARVGFLLFLAVASAPLGVAGFLAGYIDEQVPSAPAVRWWRRGLALGLGMIAAMASLSIGLKLSAVLPDTGWWRTSATGACLLLVGGMAGYLYAPLFRFMSRRLAADSAGERAG